MACVSPIQNTDCFCGTFATPVHPDKGTCSPYRLKIDCEGAVIPVNTCDDEHAFVEYDPTKTPPFSVVAHVFDTQCLEILDTNNAAISGPTT